jgi:trimeric autotransporter adhesin
MMFKFLNRTNGVYPDNQVWWSVKINGVTITHSIAEQSTFDMPANSSGRVYVYLGPGTDATAVNSKYFDFMEYTIGDNPPAFHGNTTRVDAFGIKLTMQMLCGIRMPSTVLPMGFPMTTLAVIPPIFRMTTR